MTTQALSLPRNIPWKLIGVSSDMMDDKFCNKEFPFAWRSSLAISAYEPSPDDLPDDLCEGRITYLKITSSITGYQPSKEETDELTQVEGLLRNSFPDIPTEDLRADIDRITDEYFACYGALLNIAVFPYPETKTELIERNRIDFSSLEQTEPGTLLSNPFVHGSGVEFEAPGQDDNHLVDIFPEDGDNEAELDLQGEMVVTVPPTSGLAAVEANVAHYTAAGVTMEAFVGNESVGKETSGLEQGQEHRLLIEGEDIDRVVLTASDGEASLLEFAYFIGRDVPVELEDFPHIISIEPRKRDLYQAATETGEVLSASKSGINTDKSLTEIDSTESSISFEAAAEMAVPGSPFTVSNAGKTTRTNVDTDQERWAVQTDASRERRETEGMSTQISQLYNLLTGYHVGTNRDVHLLLARPHVLQPTDFRTFVQGLRAIEGIQEFFLVVARPEEVEGLCIEAYLETGHFAEDTPIIEPEEEYEESHLDFVFTARAKGAGPFGDVNPFDDPQCINLENFPIPLNLPTGWLVDTRERRKRTPGEPVGTGWDEGHTGVADLDQENALLPNHINYQATNDALTVYGELCGDSDLISTGEDNTFRRRFRVFTRSEEPRRSHEETRADIGRLLITNRGLCACFESGECPEVVPAPEPERPIIESIVDEPVLEMNSALLTSHATNQSRMPAMKELLRQIQSSMATSWRTPRRRPFGAVGFLESDYFTQQIADLLPDEYLERPLTRLPGVPNKAVELLGEDRSIGEALEMDLSRFARLTGTNIEEASELRHQLLGLAPKSDDGGKGTDEGNDVVE